MERYNILPADTYIVINKSILNRVNLICEKFIIIDDYLINL